MESYGFFQIIIAVIVLLQFLFIGMYNLAVFHVPHRAYISLFVLEIIVLLGLIIGRAVQDTCWIFSGSFWLSTVVLFFVYTAYVYLLPVIIVPEKQYIMTICSKEEIPEHGICLVGTIQEDWCSVQVVLEGRPYACELCSRIELPVKLKTDGKLSERRYGLLPVVTLV